MITGAFRYALYLVPERQSLLWQIGSSLLGYDSITGENIPQPVVDGVAPEQLAAQTAEPRRYGFHLTVKAPFRLAEGCSIEGLVEAAQTLACDFPALSLGALRLKVRRTRAQTDGFICLEPREMPDSLAALERAIVIGTDRFRASLTSEEIARRSPDRLTPRQRTLLDRFGYPFVLDEFRPHFSLTGNIGEGGCCLAGFEALLGPALQEAPRLRYRLALFSQREAGETFRLERVL